MYIELYMNSHIFLEIIEDFSEGTEPLEESASEPILDPELRFDNIYQDSTDVIPHDDNNADDSRDTTCCKKK